MANGDFSILVCFAVAQASFTTLIAKSGRKRQIYRQALFDDKVANLTNWRRQSGNTEKSRQLAFPRPCRFCLAPNVSPVRSYNRKVDKCHQICMERAKDTVCVVVLNFS